MEKLTFEEPRIEEQMTPEEQFSSLEQEGALKSLHEALPGLTDDEFRDFFVSIEYTDESGGWYSFTVNGHKVQMQLNLKTVWMDGKPGSFEAAEIMLKRWAIPATIAMSLKRRSVEE